VHKRIVWREKSLASDMIAPVHVANLSCDAIALAEKIHALHG